VSGEESLMMSFGPHSVPAFDVYYSLYVSHTFSPSFSLPSLLSFQFDLFDVHVCAEQELVKIWTPWRQVVLNSARRMPA